MTRRAPTWPCPEQGFRCPPGQGLQSGPKKPRQQAGVWKRRVRVQQLLVEEAEEEVEEAEEAGSPYRHRDVAQRRAACGRNLQSGSADGQREDTPQGGGALSRHIRQSRLGGGSSLQEPSYRGNSRGTRGQADSGAADTVTLEGDERLKLSEERGRGLSPHLHHLGLGHVTPVGQHRCDGGRDQDSVHHVQTAVFRLHRRFQHRSSAHRDLTLEHSSGQSLPLLGNRQPITLTFSVTLMVRTWLASETTLGRDTMLKTSSLKGGRSRMRAERGRRGGATRDRVN